MIYIVSKQNSNRFKYVLDLVFNHYLGMEYTVVPEPKYNAINILYGPNKEFSVPDSGLLWQTGYNKLENLATLGSWNKMPTFFTTDQNHTIPFDFFSAIFYLVSRYEEYGNFVPDIHNRFPPEASILVKNNWIKKPLVNLWINALLEELLLVWPLLKCKPRKFEFISTIDVDLAWKYKNKGWLRNLGGIGSDVLGLKFEKLKERWNIFTKHSQDPFYNFDYQKQLHLQYETDNRFFILLGERRKYDKNTAPNNLYFRQLIRQLNVNCEVGNKDKTRVKQEIGTLENILGNPVNISRQHFLMHNMPQTYNHLIELGIKQDYTMGYTSYSGFRAGIAAPFFWYDLLHEVQTDLLLVPFCHMDITPRHYESKTIEQACEELTIFMKEVADAKGLFSILWHNESLSNSEQWQGWNKLYEHTLAEAQRLKKGN
jgi:hypothetical protein